MLPARGPGGFDARWCATAVGCAFGLLVLDGYGAIHFSARAPEELPYLACLALAGGTVLGLLRAVLRAIEQTWPRSTVLVAVTLALLVAPWCWQSAGEFSEGEGITALGLVPLHVHVAASAALIVGLVATWWWQRGTLPLWLHVVLGLLALPPLAYLEQRFLRTYGMFAPFFVIEPIVILTSVSAELLARRPRAHAVVAGSAWVLIGTLASLAFARPGLLALGRRTVLADEMGALVIDPLLFSSHAAAVQLRALDGQALRCEQPFPPAPWPELALSADQRRNVVLISVDALRADALGPQPRVPSRTPNLDRFLAESRVAKQAYTTYPATLFALASAVTGLLPSDILFAPKPPPTLFRLLKSKVDQALAVLPNNFWFNQPALQQYVFQGVSVQRHQGAHDATAEAIRRLKGYRKNGTRHLLWVHYLEPHQPFQIHPDFDFGSTPAQRYASEVAFLDHELGGLFEVLRSGGWYDDSLILFFADHGEALGEHGYVGHHVFLNRWITQIPFAIHVPQAGSAPIDGLVQITDVAATALHFLGAKPHHGAGRSLLAVDPPVGRDLISEAFPVRGKALFELAQTPIGSRAELAARIERIQHGDRRYQPKVALIRDHYQLIMNRVTGTAELYDLRDPREQHEQSGQHSAVLKAMMSRLEQFHEQQSQSLSCALPR